MDEVEVACPYCGYKNTIGDCWEFHNDEEVEVECTGCEKWFYFNLHMDIEYSAEYVRKEKHES